MSTRFGIPANWTDQDAPLSQLQFLAGPEQTCASQGSNSLAVPPGGIEVCFDGFERTVPRGRQELAQMLWEVHNS
jgi:hypothetical protein